LWTTRWGETAVSLTPGGGKQELVGASKLWTSFSPKVELPHLAGDYFFSSTSSPWAAILRMSSVIRIEQYLGPHMLQKWALLKVSWGSVSS
jgi:hypothetical protein